MKSNAIKVPNMSTAKVQDLQNEIAHLSQQLEEMEKQENCNHQWMPSATSSGVNECHLCGDWECDASYNLALQMKYRFGL